MGDEECRKYCKNLFKKSEKKKKKKLLIINVLFFIYIFGHLTLTYKVYISLRHI